jgi:hypothetical protein
LKKDEKWELSWSFLIMGEKRKLSVSRPDISSQESMISGLDLGSVRGVGKMEPRVNRGDGVGGVVVVCGGGVGGGNGSRLRRP